MTKHVSVSTYIDLCELGGCPGLLVRITYIDDSCSAMAAHQYGILLQNTWEKITVRFDSHQIDFYWDKPGTRRITSIQKLLDGVDIMFLQEAYLRTPESVAYSPPWETRAA